MVEYYWSRVVGKFVDKYTGEETCLFPDGRRMCTFTGTVREWYETLVEVIYDVAGSLAKNGLDTETLANIKLVGEPNVSTIVMCSVLYHTRTSFGFPLFIEESPDMGDSPRIELVSGETGEALGIVHVLDAGPWEKNPCRDV